VKTSDPMISFSRLHLGRVPGVKVLKILIRYIVVAMVQKVIRQ
jgi:hypothetical protein